MAPPAGLWCGRRPDSLPARWIKKQNAGQPKITAREYTTSAIAYNRRMSTRQTAALLPTAGRHGQRLDNFLIGRLRDVPKSRVYRLIRTGQVRVNGARRKPEYRIKPGDLVRVPPLWRKSPPDAAPPVPLDLPVLFADADLLALDKPAGLAVHGGSGVRYGVIERLRSGGGGGNGDAGVGNGGGGGGGGGLDSGNGDAGADFLELAHRLDRETSGCLLLARNRPALLALHRQFRGEGGTAPGKIYTALLCGKLARPQTITAPVAGRAAHSRLRPLRACGGFTLAEIRLRTGRTHQARAHAAAAGHPIAGDRRYGDPECNRRLRTAGLRRLFLHARRLRFTHPRTGRAITLTAPLPAELGEVLGRL